MLSWRVEKWRTILIWFKNYFGYMVASGHRYNALWKLISGKSLTLSNGISWKIFFVCLGTPIYLSILLCNVLWLPLFQWLSVEISTGISKGKVGSDKVICYPHIFIYAIGNIFLGCSSRLLIFQDFIFTQSVVLLLFFTWLLRIMSPLSREVRD